VVVEKHFGRDLDSARESKVQKPNSAASTAMNGSKVIGCNNDDSLKTKLFGSDATATLHN
jgi:hypothetical protein